VRQSHVLGLAEATVIEGEDTMDEDNVDEDQSIDDSKDIDEDDEEDGRASHERLERLKPQSTAAMRSWTRRRSSTPDRAGRVVSRSTTRARTWCEATLTPAARRRRMLVPTRARSLLRCDFA